MKPFYANNLEWYLKELISSQKLFESKNTKVCASVNHNTNEYFKNINHAIKTVNHTYDFI